MEGKQAEQSTLVLKYDGRCLVMDPSPHSRFATTQWTLVWNAAVEDSKHGRPHCRKSCGVTGFHSTDLRDSVVYLLPMRRMQPRVLAHLFDDDILAKADPAKGRFRSFLLTVWKSFLIDRYRQGMRQKRGAGANIMSRSSSPKAKLAGRM